MSPRLAAAGRRGSAERGGARAAASASANAPAGKPAAPLLARVTVIMLMIPFGFSLGPLAMTPAKLFFLIMFPGLAVGLFGGRFGKIVATDVLMLLFLIWMILSMFVNHEPKVALQYAGSNVLLIFGGYLCARASIRTKEDFLGFIRFFTMMLFVTMPFALYEAVFDVAPLVKLAKMIPGVEVVAMARTEPRMGLHRVQMVFDHPIHYGLFASSAVALAFLGLKATMGGLQRMFRFAVTVACSAMSMSSGAILAVGGQIGLFIYDHITRNFVGRWRVLGITAAIGYVIVEVSTTGWGMLAIVQRISFSANSSRLRAVLLDFGLAQIERTPFFGFGFHRWPLPSWMTGSMDNYWLLIAVTFGLPAFAFFFWAIIGSMVSVGKRNFSGDPDLILLRRAWIFMMASLCMSMFTVAIWGVMSSVVTFLFGTGIWMLNAGEPAAQPERPARASKRANSRGAPA